MSDKCRDKQSCFFFFLQNLLKLLFYIYFLRSLLYHQVEYLVKAKMPASERKEEKRALGRQRRTLYSRKFRKVSREISVRERARNVYKRHSRQLYPRSYFALLCHGVCGPVPRLAKSAPPPAKFQGILPASKRNLHREICSVLCTSRAHKVIPCGHLLAFTLSWIRFSRLHVSFRRGVRTLFLDNYQSKIAAYN